MDNPITYTLAPKEGSTDFYKDLSLYTHKVLAEARARFGAIVDDYRSYLFRERIERVRSGDEYLLEVIIAGVLLKNYYGKALQVGSLTTRLLNRLYLLRKAHQHLKPLIDKARGVLSYWMLERKAAKAGSYTLHGWTRLLSWLRATGEFNEEIIRLDPWTRFYQGRPSRETQWLLQSAAAFASFLEQEGERCLGAYVCGVPHFLKYVAPKHRYHEDYFFVSRGRNEYFMNMLGAEILNRHLRDRFRAMAHKAVLLPTCMRTSPAKGCGARDDGKGMICMQCSRDCHVGRIATAMKKQQVKSYLIPHSSGFSRFLRKWENSPDTGLVGVTCILNLLTGGYEMIRLNIPAQCIFLDYCGCQKHWDPMGIPTSLNVEALVRTVS